MNKRGLKIGTYDTVANGWTLTGYKLSAAEQKTNFLDKPNGDGAWDLSTALTDGIARYKSRTLTATFECSEGDRQSRETEIRRMINSLDGMREDIKLPDDDMHHITGRVHVEREYNDLAHAAVTVTAVCEPWKEADAETIVNVIALTAKQELVLHNNGRRAVVPTITVAGDFVLLEYGGASTAMSPGVYQWPNLILLPGSLALKYSGRGKVTFAYREAVLE